MFEDEGLNMFHNTSLAWIIRENAGCLYKPPNSKTGVLPLGAGRSGRICVVAKGSRYEEQDRYRVCGTPPFPKCKKAKACIPPDTGTHLPNLPFDVAHLQPLRPVNNPG